VSHFRVFSYKCFVLKQGKLDKFESRSSDDIFLGYALHSRVYRVLNLETNHNMETCDITFYETIPCTTPVSETTGEKKTGKSIFVEDELEDANCGDHEPTPLAAPIDPASTTSVDRSSSTTSSSSGPLGREAPCAPRKREKGSPGGGRIAANNTSLSCARLRKDVREWLQQCRPPPRRQIKEYQVVPR
jgi:hypothetical protein